MHLDCVVGCSTTYNFLRQQRIQLNKFSTLGRTISLCKGPLWKRLLKVSRVFGVTCTRWKLMLCWALWDDKVGSRVSGWWWRAWISKHTSSDAWNSSPPLQCGSFGPHLLPNPLNCLGRVALWVRIVAKFRQEGIVCKTLKLERLQRFFFIIICIRKAARLWPNSLIEIQTLPKLPRFPPPSPVFL